MLKIKLIVLMFLTVNVIGSDVDIRTNLDMKYKHMEIETTESDETKIYREIKLKPYLQYYNEYLGVSVKSEIVFMTRDGEGTISPKSTSLFCPNFSNQDESTSAAYVNSLYIEKEFRTENTISTIGVGIPPFSDGWPNEYRTHNIPRGTGMAPLVQMSRESIYYTNNFTNLTSFDNAKFMISYGSIMDIIPTNKDYQNEKYLGSYGTIAYLEIEEDKNKYKLMYQHDTIKFYNASSLDASDHKSWKLGTTDIIGIGYAFDNLDDSGNIFYNIFSASYHKPDREMTEIQTLIRECAGRRINRGEFGDGIYNELADTSDSYGWSNLIGFKQEFDNVIFNKTMYLGAEWFTTSKDWFTEATDTPNSTLYNLYTKGNVYTVYSGIYFQPNMSLNISYSRVENKWVNEMGSVNVGYSVENTVRDAYKNNNIVQIQYVWDF